MSDNHTGARLAEPTAPTGVDDVWAALIRAVAYVRVLGEDEVGEEVAANDGDLAIDSKDAVVVIPIAEGELGGKRLMEVSDLKRRDLSSLRTLAELMWSRWLERNSEDGT